MKNILLCLLSITTIAAGMQQQGDDTATAVSVEADVIEDMQNTLDVIEEIKLEAWKDFISNQPRKKISTLIRKNRFNLPIPFYAELAYMVFTETDHLTLKQKKRLLQRIHKEYLNRATSEQRHIDEKTFHSIDHLNDSCELLKNMEYVNSMPPVTHNSKAKKDYPAFALTRAKQKRDAHEEKYSEQNPYQEVITFLESHGARDYQTH